MNERQTEDRRLTAVRLAAAPAPRKKPGKIIAIAVMVAVIAFAGGLAGGYIGDKVQPALTTIDRSAKGDGNRIVTQEEEDIADVATKVGESVVSIVTQGQSESRFGTSAMEGAGTGIIVSKDGYVLTNKHVINGAQALRVVMSNGNTFKDVKVVGVDPLNDIAFIKIGGVDNLKPAELGDSTSIRTGQKVVAIGNALGQYSNSVTSGIISGTGRSVTASVDESGRDSETLSDLIQTDAAINSGNSGGPLTNIAGQVIGVNTALASDANSIGFAIPINAVKGMLKGVLAKGKVERPFIGVNYVAITPDVAEEYKLPVKKGAYVVTGGSTPAVVPGSPADKAGLKDKDIITKVGDIEVSDRGSVSTLVAEYMPGDTIELTILREGKAQTVRVTLAVYQA